MKPLSVQDLDMVYELPNGGSVHALSNISFELDGGRLLTLLGPSGCGKTTLLNILAGFLAPTDGSVYLGGEPITGPSKDRGMVFQQGALFEWQSVAQNIGFGRRLELESSNRLQIFAIRAAKVVAGIALVVVLLQFITPWVVWLALFAALLGFLGYKSQRKGPGKPQPYDDEVNRLLDVVGLSGFGDKQVYELSGGMQQRVALARCLANDPDMMLMDEPLGALDALTREKMQSLILNLWDETGKTIVMVTHSVEEALLLGDIVFVMAPRPGRIEKVYELPFAKRALTEDPRELKKGADFQEVKEEILSFIWEMEEEIMGREASV